MRNITKPEDSNIKQMPDYRIPRHYHDYAAPRVLQEQIALFIDQVKAQLGCREESPIVEAFRGEAFFIESINKRTADFNLGDLIAPDGENSCYRMDIPQDAVIAYAFTHPDNEGKNPPFKDEDLYPGFRMELLKMLFDYNNPSTKYQFKRTGPMEDRQGVSRGFPLVLLVPLKKNHHHVSQFLEGEAEMEMYRKGLRTISSGNVIKNFC